MMPDPSPDVEILSRKTAFKRFFQMDVLSLRHRRFDGGMTPPIERELFIRRPAVAVLPYDPATDQVVLVEQFRLGALMADLPAWQLEVIAGLAEPDEDPLQVAIRETREEAGCEITDPIEICRYMTSPGGTNEVVTFYCAKVDTDGVGGLHGMSDEHEDIRVHVMTLPDAMNRIATGQITNALAIIALQWLTINREDVRGAWQ